MHKSVDPQRNSVQSKPASGSRWRNYYELLGLANFESNAESIAAGRDRILARLQQVPAENRRDQWKKRVVEVRRAAKCLLDPDDRAAYDAALRGQQPSAPIATLISGRTVAGAPMARLLDAQYGSHDFESSSSESLDAALLAVPGGPFPTDADVGATAAATSVLPPIPASDGPDRGGRRAGRSRKRNMAGQWIVVVLLLGGVGIAGVFMLRVFREQGLFSEGAHESVADGRREQNFPQSAVQNPINSAHGEPAAAPSNNGPIKQLERRRATPVKARRGESAAAGVKRDQAAARAVVTSGDPQAGQTAVVREPSANREFEPLGNAQQDKVRQIFAALSQCDTARAGAMISALRSDAELAWPHDVVSSLHALCRHVEFFWEAVESAKQDLKSGDVLPYKNSKAAVVSVSDDRLELRAAGRNVVVRAKPLPNWLVAVLADRAMDKDDPANWVTRGAYQFASPDGDLSAARALWTRAVRAGEPVEFLLPLLEWEHLRPSAD